MGKEIQDLDLNQAEWVLESELSTLELYVHLNNCVTRCWFRVAIESRSLDLTGKEKELVKNPLRALKALFLKLRIPLHKKFLLRVLHRYACFE